VRARRVGDRLQVRVQDRGDGQRIRLPAGRGLGLSNLRARLNQLHGANAELRFECSDHGAVVEMILPYRRQAAVEPDAPMETIQA
jgi:two-component system LytT family sensor kinase